MYFAELCYFGLLFVICVSLWKCILFECIKYRERLADYELLKTRPELVCLKGIVTVFLKIACLHCSVKPCEVLWRYIKTFLLGSKFCNFFNNLYPFCVYGRINICLKFKHMIIFCFNLQSHVLIMTHKNREIMIISSRIYSEPDIKHIKQGVLEKVNWSTQLCFWKGREI